MFSATNFIYDGISADTYGLKIASFESDTVETTEAFSPTLTTLKSSKSHRFQYAGITYSDPPTASFTIVSEKALSSEERTEILRWLVGRKGFKELVIEQDDLENYTYRCIFTGVEMVYVNGALHGFTLTATFDSPYAYFYKELIYTGTGTETTVTINVNSDLMDEYTYPTVIFTPSSSYSTIKIYNDTDDSTRLFTFTGLAANTEYTVDNELRIVSGGTGSNLIEQFQDSSGGNKRKWLRFVSGNNVIRYTFNGTIRFKIPVYKAIGF